MLILTVVSGVRETAVSDNEEPDVLDPLPSVPPPVPPSVPPPVPPLLSVDSGLPTGKQKT